MYQLLYKDDAKELANQVLVMVLATPGMGAEQLQCCWELV
jgi:hypothetical protein